MRKIKAFLYQQRDSALSVGRAKTGGLTILALVALRLAVGWHFFSEGSQKLAYDPEAGSYRVDFTAEPFLTGAKGPLAGMMRDFAPGSHDWREKLAVPQQTVPLDPEEQTRRAQWAYDYTQRRAQAERDKSAIPIEIPDFAPYDAWGRQIVSDWESVLDEFLETPSLTDEQREQGAAVLHARHQQLADYLASESDAIAEYRHELWRLEQLETKPMTGELPFHDERIAVKSAETSAKPLKWVAQVNEFETHFQNDLRGLLSDDQATDEQSQESRHEALTDPGETRLSRVNLSITCLTVLVGVCLLLGFFTRLASLAGLAFLLAVMASQPPWVTGARTDFLFYQLVECASLLVLCIVGAGRWFGLDFFTYALWNRIRGNTDDED